MSTSTDATTELQPKLYINGRAFFRGWEGYVAFKRALDDPDWHDQPHASPGDKVRFASMFFGNFPITAANADYSAVGRFYPVHQGLPAPLRRKYVPDRYVTLRSGTRVKNVPSDYERERLNELDDRLDIFPPVLAQGPEGTCKGGLAGFGYMAICERRWYPMGFLEAFINGRITEEQFQVCELTNRELQGRLPLKDVWTVRPQDCAEGFKWKTWYGGNLFDYPHGDLTPERQTMLNDWQDEDWPGGPEYAARCELDRRKTTVFDYVGAPDDEGGKSVVLPAGRMTSFKLGQVRKKLLEHSRERLAQGRPASKTVPRGNDLHRAFVWPYWPDMM